MSEHDYSGIDTRSGRWWPVMGVWLMILGSVGGLMLLAVFWGHAFGN